MIEGGRVVRSALPGNGILGAGKWNLNRLLSANTSSASSFQIMNKDLFFSSPALDDFRS